MEVAEPLAFQSLKGILVDFNDGRANHEATQNR